MWTVGQTVTSFLSVNLLINVYLQKSIMYNIRLDLDEGTVSDNCVLKVKKLFINNSPVTRSVILSWSLVLSYFRGENACGPRYPYYRFTYTGYHTSPPTSLLTQVVIIHDLFIYVLCPISISPSTSTTISVPSVSSGVPLPW